MNIAGRRILVLEDEPIIAFDLEDLLSEKEARPAMAGTMAQAMEMLSETQFDCAILDVNLRGEKSYPVAHALRERDIPFIFATGYGDAEHPADFAQVPTITKPYTIDQIGQAFAQLD